MFLSTTFFFPFRKIEVFLFLLSNTIFDTTILESELKVLIYKDIHAIQSINLQNKFRNTKYGRIIELNTFSN